MPIVSGYDLSLLARKTANHKLPICFVSVMPEHIVDMKNVDGFIQKPFTSESLLKGVDSVLSKCGGVR